MRTWLTAALVLLVCADAAAQVYVAPRRPGKSVVRYTAHDWHHLDLLVDEEFDGEEAGGLRLFFYEQERESAERAAASIVEGYRYLVDAFDHVPRHRFPYVLYNSYQEFLRTNLFPLQEGTLGVTSTRGDLVLTLPYFGDHPRFEHVSTHEMAHQFTIQKVRTLARDAELGGDPLQAMPLWFIEGLAEFYAQEGLDPEAQMVLRDVVANPNLYLGHGLVDFFDDYPGSVMWTYKIGQARVTFLEETYGEGTIQDLLEATVDLVPAGRTGSSSPRGFRDLVEQVTGDPPHRVDARFKDWARRFAYPEWLASGQTTADVEPFPDARGIVTALASSPGGDLLLYRSIDPQTGRSRLVLTDPRSPNQQRRVAIEGVPGVESLHPVEDRNFDLGGERLVYVAEARGRDLLYFRDLHHEAVRHDEPPPDDTPPPHRDPFDEEPVPLPDPVEWSGEPWWDVRLRLGATRSYDLGEHDLVAVFAPSLSPDTRRVAFVGLDDRGRKDVYVLDPDAGEITRITDDPFAERHLDWGPDGVVFNSTATEHGHFNLFTADPDTGEVTRLTTEARDHLTPTVTPEGRVFFIAWDEEARADLHEVVDGAVVERSKVTTGLFSPNPGPDGGLWTLMHHEGRRVPVQVPSSTLLDGEPRPQVAPTTDVAERPRLSLDDAEAYSPLKPANWRGDQIFGYLGAGPGAVYGQVFASASDTLRDHALVLNFNAYGSFELTDGYLLYLNQHHRTIFGGGPFQSLRFRVEDEDGFVFRSAERFYGATLSARYPLSRYTYFQVDESLGAVTYFLPNYLDWQLPPATNREWERESARTHPHSETTLRFGYDTVQYHRLTGPHAGSALLLDGIFGVQPFQNDGFVSFRLDGQHYVPVPLIPGANIAFRTSGGTTWGGRAARRFFLSSYDSLRAVPFGDLDLLGKHFVFGTTELQIPLDSILRVAFVTGIEGVVGLDAGAIADDPEDLWDRRVLDVALGGNVVFSPLVLRVHFARALDVGAPIPDAPNPWVPNVSLTWIQAQ